MVLLAQVLRMMKEKLSEASEVRLNLISLKAELDHMRLTVL